MWLADSNVWLALTWDRHPQHSQAARWFDSVGDAALLFCRFTMLGLLRLLTNRQVMGDSTASLFGWRRFALSWSWLSATTSFLVTRPQGTWNLYPVRHIASVRSPGVSSLSLPMTS